MPSAPFRLMPRTAAPVAPRQPLRFIHGYDPRYLPGLEKHGLLNRDSGLKLTQHFATPEEEKFNRLAARGGALHRWVRERRCPFYIDRLQGGTFYHRYDFDASLLREYQDLLGPGFLGIQMHEWGSVLAYDWERIRKQMGDAPPPWSERQIHDAIQKASACPWCIHLSSGTPLEFSGEKYPETLTEYLRQMRELFRRRQSETLGLLLPCDANAMATPMEYALGTRAAMVEIGAQTPLTRLQVAMVRGFSEAAGRAWGTYYEPWGGKPLSACHFFEEPLNEWRMDNTIFPFDFSSGGPNGGSSRSLQRRLLYHSLLSGAHFLSEEWGVSNTFADWREYPLTPYGEIKKDFIEFAEDHPALTPFIPFALVLPRELEVVPLAEIADPDSVTCLGRPIETGLRSLFDPVRQVLRRIYARDGTARGNEGHALTNSRFGDFFDVIGEDAGDAVFSRYAVLVDTRPEGGFARSAVAQGHRVIESADLDRLEQDLDRIIDAEFPCRVSGGVHWMLNRSDDQWLLALFNNEGVDRSVEGGDQFFRAADLTATLHFRSEPERLQAVKRWPTDASLQRAADGTFTCEVPAGGLVLLTFHLPHP